MIYLREIHGCSVCFGTAATYGELCGHASANSTPNASSTPAPTMPTAGLASPLAAHSLDRLLSYPRAAPVLAQPSSASSAACSDCKPPPAAGASEGDLIWHHLGRRRGARRGPASKQPTRFAACGSATTSKGGRSPRSRSAGWSSRSTIVRLRSSFSAARMPTWESVNH